MNYTNKICSFTGYRTNKLNASLVKGNATVEQVKAALEKEIKRMFMSEFTRFQCGMALGSDLLFAETVLGLKKLYPAVTLAAVIPCLEHDRQWDYTQRMRLSGIVAEADEVVTVSETPYYNGCMQKRNRYLVDTCDELLAVYDGMKGGTMQTVNYAKTKAKRITVIDPSKGVKVSLLQYRAKAQ